MTRVVLSYIKRHFAVIVSVISTGVIFFTVFSLYDLPWEAVAYAWLLSAATVTCMGGVRFCAFLKRHRRLTEILQRCAVELSDMPEALSIIEEDYQQIACELFESRAEASSAADRQRRETEDYYTLWAHQVKTPIAAMRLLLQSGGDEKALSAELFRIEQYVDMVLGYVRAGSSSSDYVLGRFSLDGMVRQAVRKYAKVFISKKVSLDYRGTDMEALTDEKWFVFVLEQILSNALKYTPSGGRVSIYGNGQSLVIEDMGIGIQPEDLPRVFEKGYTGYNGRADKKSTGIGLYLCKKIMKKLGHDIRIESEEGEGTRVILSLDSAKIQPE